MSLNNLYFYGKPYTVRALNQPISVELQGQGFVTMPLTLLIDLPSLPGDPIDPTQDFGDNGPFSPGIPGVNNPPLAVPQWYLYDHLGNTRSMLTYDCSDDEFFVTFAADYYPYGKTLWEYHLTHLDGKPLEPGYEENARYMSTQHERDKQTNFDFRGARYYDSNIARFLSVDPLAADYTAWSPYNYVLGNPVRFVDPDGRAPVDNILYVLVLQRAATTGIDFKSVEQTANSGFTSLGLRTEIKIITEISTFDYGKLDKTDGVLIIGSNSSEISSYVDNADDGGYLEWDGNGVVKTMADGSLEKTKRGGHTSISTLDVLSNYSKELNAGPEEVLAFMAVHSAGHQAGIGHDGADIPLMYDAKVIGSMIWNQGNSCYTTLSDFFGPDDYNKWFEKLHNRFGNENPVDSQLENDSQ